MKYHPPSIQPLKNIFFKNIKALPSLLPEFLPLLLKKRRWVFLVPKYHYGITSSFSVFLAEIHWRAITVIGVFVYGPFLLYLIRLTKLSYLLVSKAKSNIWHFQIMFYTTNNLNLTSLFRSALDPGVIAKVLVNKHMRVNIWEPLIAVSRPVGDQYVLSFQKIHKLFSFLCQKRECDIFSEYNRFISSPATH